MMIERFLQKVLLFIIPIVILVACVEGYLQYYPSTFQLKARYIKSNKANIKVLILGSSHSEAAINPEYFSTDYVSNLAYGGQDLQLDAELLKRYVGELPHLKYVCLELSYHTLEFSNSPEYERNTLYLRFHDINNFGRKNNLHDYSILFTNPKLYLTFLNPLSPKVPMNKYGFATELSPFDEGHHRFERLKYDSDAISRDRNNMFILRHKYEDLKTYEKNKVIFENMICECIHRHIKPIIIIPPVYQTYYEEMLPAKKARRDKLVEDCIRKYPSVTLFNCENNRDFLITDFINEDHLSPQAAKKFTLKIDSVIHAMEYPRLPHHKDG